MKKLLFFVMLAVWCLTSNALPFEVDGLKYTVNNDGTTVTVSKGTKTTGELIIPETVTYNGNTYSVTSIGNSAFSGCSGLTSVTIPNSDTSIGSCAFQQCSGLTSVTIPNSVTSIGNNAFDGCSGFTGSLTIPNSVTSIGRSAFNGCNGFTGSLTIPNSVTSIGGGAFSGCSFDKLFFNAVDCGDFYTQINSSTIEIGAGFGGATFNEVVIGDAVTHVPGFFLYNCNLNSATLTIGNSVTSIGRRAFYKCSGLTSVTIGNSVTTIGEDAFYECSGLTSLTIGNSVTCIGKYAFYGCSGLAGELIIPNAVTEIGYRAFSGCSFDKLFFNAVNCGDLYTQNNTNSYTLYPPFDGNTFNEVVIGDSVTHVPGYLLYNCNLNSATLTIGNSVTSIGYNAFYRCNYIINLIWNAINCSSNGSMTTSNIENVTIGEQVHVLPNDFVRDSKIMSVYIPNSVTEIGYRAFSGCSGLTGELVIPNSVTSIGNYAFYSCSGFTSLTIPNSVTSIGSRAFSCSGLTDIYTEILRPLDVPLGDYVFFDVNKRTCVLHVPAGTLEDYKVAAQWKDFFHIQEPFTAITALELSPKNAEVLEGGTIAITPVFTPSYATNQTLTWTSSDETIATVDEQGVVTGVKVGNTTISATTTDDSDITATCQVTVKPVVATGISVDPIAVTITAGETTQLSVTMTPTNATYKTATWSSSDEAIATVDENGVVTGIAAGQAQVTATTIDGTNLSATSVVTVLPRKATDITISPDSVIIDISGSVHLTATIAPEDVESNVLLWESSDEDVAIVTSKGMVYGVGAGQALITATTTDGSNLSDTCHVTVRVPFELTAQSLAIPVNARRNIPIMIDNHVDVKSFAFTVNLPDSIRITDDALAAPRCGDFNITTSYNADSTVVHIEGVMTSTAMGAGTGAFVLLPVKSCSLIDDFYAELTGISFTSTNDGVGTQLLDDVTVSIHVLNLGDANGDKLVNVSDVTTLINYILGMQSDLTNFGVGDINNDGCINVSDITALINLILGIY